MSPVTLVAIGLGGFALFLLIIGALITVREERSLEVQRLDRFLEEQRSLEAIQVEKPTPLTDWLNEAATRFAWGEALSRDLARADLKLRVGEYIALTIISIFGFALVAYFLGGRALPAAGIGAVIGFFAPRIYVGRQKAARLVRFDEQLSDMLNLMVNGLRAGYSTMQAMEAVSKELPSPICDEFRRVVQEMQLGIPMERALDNLVRRIPSRDLDLVVTAINVQREVGGNLAEILATISHTIRERVRVKGEIRVLTTQAMTSAKFLSAMPVFVMLALYFLNRDYVMEFFKPDTRTWGIISLGIGAGMIGLGYFVMTRIAAIDI
jgi:tight adherence protein B